MSYPAVAAGAYLHHLEITSPDPERLAGYYAQALQMQAARSGDRFLCQGPARRMLFAKGPAGSLSYAAFACRDRIAFDALKGHVAASIGTLAPSPSPLFGDRAFAVADPEGNRIVFGLAEEDRTAQATRPGIRGPLQHVTVASTDLEAMEAFYAGKLGFAVSDLVRNSEGVVTTVFFRCNHEHHTVGCFLKSEACLDHHSYEAGEWNTIRDWADHLATLRIPIVWGPGRHGPGNNLFIFVRDPDANMIEISAELEVVYDRATTEWPHEPHTLNSWGPAMMRSP